MAFEGKTKTTQPRAATPEEMYLGGGLQRTTAAVDSLWVHQGDVIRAYANDHQDTPDLALELPTGTGKTLPGLLIGEWVRQEGAGPVIYATPTSQLARQVHATAEREGIPARLLVGRYTEWSTADEAAVEGGQALAITNYSTIFNSHPKLPVPRLILLDDAHAGEQFVGERYGVTIRRYAEPDAYATVLDALAPLLSGLLLQRLRSDTPDPGAHHAVRLLQPALMPGVLERLDVALESLPMPHNFELAMIRAGLPACLVYLSYGAIEIRPMVPPTFENRVFAGATQRIYLSATLGAGGELERAFGRPAITRLPLPGKASPRSGRRLFVFPDLAAGDEPDTLVKQIVEVADKALVLTQKTVEKAEDAARAVASPGHRVYRKDEVERDLSVFAKAPSGVLGLANRYDGLDLPGDDCRLVILDGKPDAASLQERFLGERADAHAALAERTRTRIVQGAGRCTRGPNDYAVVVVRGSDITRYFSRPEHLDALEAELQAEIQFGWQNSVGKSHDQILENVKTFLEHGQDWREGGEPALAEFRQDATKTPAPGTSAIGSAAVHEVAAATYAYRGEWIAASQAMQEAARSVGLGGDATRGYRAVLLYLAGVWLQRGATGEAERSRARALVRQASEAAGTRGAWLREMTTLPGAEPEALPRMDTVAIQDIAARLSEGVNSGKLETKTTGMLADLAQEDATQYERGLATLGGLLGAESFKPPGQGRCDAAWLWDTAIWMTLEAKSEQEDGVLALKYIRQANTQLDQLTGDRGVDHPPAGSPAVIITERTVDPQHARAANPNLYVVSPPLVEELAADAAGVWRALRASAVGITDGAALRAHVQDVLSEHGCLPSQVVERLTQNRIRP